MQENTESVSGPMLVGFRNRTLLIVNTLSRKGLSRWVSYWLASGREQSYFRGDWLRLANIIVEHVQQLQQCKTKWGKLHIPMLNLFTSMTYEP